MEGRVLPVKTYTVYSLTVEDLTPDEMFGSTDDLGSAFVIACAVWQQGQQLSASWSDRKIGVFDGADTFVGHIGG